MTIYADWDMRCWQPDSGQHALSLASQHEAHIDLLITDVIMPKMNGRELSETLASLRPDLKTIYMSGYTDDAIVRYCVCEKGRSISAEALQSCYAYAQGARFARAE